ncbi:MAG: hypothetical protein LBL82_01425 [Oscillospiraceae bacterium]|jgi:WD40 repeat protein|nr:hypothetical protein [Oscillospiraceae bacterium]
MTNVFYYRDIVSIDKDGIWFAPPYKTETFVSFSECVKNFAKEWSAETGRNIDETAITCIGTRDHSRGYFNLFSSPETIIVTLSADDLNFFLLNRLMGGKRLQENQFRALQAKILEVGYSTLDLT